MNLIYQLFDLSNKVVIVAVGQGKQVLQQTSYLQMKGANIPLSNLSIEMAQNTKEKLHRVKLDVSDIKQIPSFH